MNIGRIAFLVGLALAVIVGAGTVMPYAVLAVIVSPAAVAVLGAVSGYLDDSDEVSVLVTALALSVVHGALGEIPTVGGHITNILGSVSALINAAALAVIVRGLIGRVMPAGKDDGGGSSF